MIITKVKKYAVVFFAVLLMGSISAPQAYAQTTPATQQQIAQLLAQISVLQAQLAALTGTGGTCTVQFSRSLGVGSSGADVLALQKFLNRSADTKLALSGAGSPGFETQYYGPVTANAVSKFQVKYRAEILSPLGLVNPTGYFGPASIAKANALCAVIVPPTQPPTTPPSDDDELEGGEASIENFEAQEGDDVTLNEGQNNVPVMDVSFDVEDGDILIDRIDVAFDHITGGDDDPWDVFEDVSIWVDDEKIADIDVSDDSVWSENTPNSGDYRLRLSEVDHIVREGETAELTVAVTVSDNVDDAGLVEWELFVPDDGVRVSDSLELTHTTGDDSQTVTFEINEAGQGSDLVVKTSNEDPEASVLQVERNDTSNWQTVFAFALDADDSDEDIEIGSITLDVDVSDTETYSAIVRDAMLVVDGEEFDDVSVSNGGTDTATLTFDLNNDLVVDTGDEVTVELQLQFKALPAADEGTTVMASISSAQADLIEAEGVDDLDDSQISGSAQGEEHELRTGGSSVGTVETSAELKTNSNSTTDDDEGVFTIEFDVTAFEQDVYINKALTRGTTQGTGGINYLIEDGQGDTIATGDISGAILDSSADSEGSRYRIDEGQTESFTLVVEYDPAASGFYNLQLYSINYNDTEDDPDTYQRALPESTYETEPLSI